MRFKLPFGWGQLWIIRDLGQAFRARTILQTNLKMQHFRNGILIEERDLGSGVVTIAGVVLMAADWTNATATLKLANWHDSGTGIITPNINDTVLQIATGGVRVAGSQTNTANTYQSVANLSYTTSLNISEWGIFTASSGITLFDHRTFTAQPVISGDVLSWIYQLQVVPGG
jgi:hypothetical protein